MLYYADKISDNIRERQPEGYLICVNVPIARSGTQKYLNDEVGKEGNADEEVTVYRPEEEVFSQATIASFEGMPVTNDHPSADEGVTKDNISWYQKGHCQNVHRGTGDEKNMLIADLVITDPETIRAVKDGKREISCGYNYELCDEDGKLVQRQIRGNHVAIVDKGRAGHRVCIKDSAPTKERRKVKMAKTKHGIWAKMLAKYAVDADPEEVAEAVEAIDEIVSEPEEEEVKGKDAEMSEKLDVLKDMIENLPKREAEEDEEPEEKPEEEEMKDAEPDKQDIIIDLLKQLVAKQGADCGPKRKAKDEDPEEDPLEKLEDDLDEIEAKEIKEEGTDADEDEEEVVPEEGFAPDEDTSEPESHFVDPEEINEKDEDEPTEAEEKPIGMDKKARDSMREVLRVVKPMIAALPPRQRKIATDAAVKSIRRSYGMSPKAVRNSYTAIKQNSKRKASDAVAKRQADQNLAKKIMESRNVNYKK